jgi:hypothetical protein
VRGNDGVIPFPGLQNSAAGVKRPTTARILGKVAGVVVAVYRRGVVRVEGISNAT